MNHEVAEIFFVLKAVHESVDKMLEGLTDEEWLTKPADNFNNVASIIEHVTQVERRFMSALAGTAEAIDSGATFRATSWDVAKIKGEWANSLPYAKSQLEQVSAEDLEKPGLKLGVGDLNRRQLITYAIGHLTHHRGQIPLVKKLLAANNLA